MRSISDIALDTADLLFFEDGVPAFLLRALASAFVIAAPPYLSFAAAEAFDMRFVWLFGMALGFLVIPFGIPAFIAQGRALNAWSIGVALALVGVVILAQAIPMEIDTAPIPIPDHIGPRAMANGTVLLACVGTTCRWLWIGVRNIAGRLL